MVVELKEPGKEPGRPGSGRQRAQAPMRCPVCDVALNMADRQGIEIDFCPQCRGVWLDRGELDKIIERTLQELTPQPAPPPRGRDDGRVRDDERHSRHGGHGKHGYRRKSWLHELFD